MAPRLTILLPLKGRHLFTLRFLWHANKARLPYRFLIADGEVHPELARILVDSRKTFPELDIEYVQYPDDVDFQHYYAKIVDALKRVRTPYVKFADNDDFLARAGLDCCMDFLDAHPDYVCCSGGIGGFSVKPPMRDPFGRVVGPFNKLSYHYAPRDRSVDLNSSSTINRVLAGLRNTWNFHAVFRTPPLALMWHEVQEMAPTSFQLQERFFAMRTLTIGKARCSAGIFSYLRQYWTSLQLHWPSSNTDMRKDFVHYLLRSSFTEDVANILKIVSRFIAEHDGGEPAKITEQLREPLAEWVGDIIRLDFGPYATLRRYVRSHAPWLVAWLKTRRRVAILVERNNLFRKLREDGATPEYLAKFRRELAQIEGVLTGYEFKQFLQQHMLKLQTPRYRITM
jgi:glycosyltransferase domain-containing protein